MVNLEEILEKKPYTCPIMVVERIDFSDILTTSSGTMEGGSPDAGGEELSGNEGNGNDFNTP